VVTTCGHSTGVGQVWIRAVHIIVFTFQVLMRIFITFLFFSSKY